MNSDEQTLQFEITIVPARGRKRGQRRRADGPKASDPLHIPRIARLMALAIKFQDMVDRGEVRDYAELARLGYVSRARITQIMNMLNLSPDIQEELLTSATFAARPTLSECNLRQVATVVVWRQQKRLWTELVSKSSRR